MYLIESHTWEAKGLYCSSIQSPSQSKSLAKVGHFGMEVRPLYEGSG